MLWPVGHDTVDAIAVEPIDIVKLRVLLRGPHYDTVSSPTNLRIHRVSQAVENFDSVDVLSVPQPAIVIAIHLPVMALNFLISHSWHKEEVIIQWVAEKTAQ